MFLTHNFYTERGVTPRFTQFKALGASPGLFYFNCQHSTVPNSVLFAGNGMRARTPIAQIVEMDTQGSPGASIPSYRTNRGLRPIRVLTPMFTSVVGILSNSPALNAVPKSRKCTMKIIQNQRKLSGFAVSAT